MEFFLNWNISTILFLYWTESGVIGFYNIFKILKASKPSESDLVISGSIKRKVGKLFIVIFFIIHFGGFMLGHYTFLVKFFNPYLNVNYLLFPIFGLFLSHGVSFVYNFLGNKEYLYMTPNQQMAEPYKRVMIMHITILFGGFLVQKYGLPIYTLLLMIFLKLVVDLYSHIKEHIKYSVSTRLSLGPFSTEQQQPKKQQMIDSATNMAEQNMNKYGLSEEQKKKARNVLNYFMPNK